MVKVVNNVVKRNWCFKEIKSSKFTDNSRAYYFEPEIDSKY
jgi:hypothetical protein